jgi:hypothetical protein
MTPAEYFYLHHAAEFDEKARAAQSPDAQLHYVQLAQAYRRLAARTNGSEPLAQKDAGAETPARRASGKLRMTVLHRLLPTSKWRSTEI